MVRVLRQVQQSLCRAVPLWMFMVITALLALRYRHHDASRLQNVNNLFLLTSMLCQAACPVFPQRWERRGHVHI